MQPCPICGAENPDTATRCQLCDAEFLALQEQEIEEGSEEIFSQPSASPHVVLGTVDAGKFQLSRVKLGVFLAILAVIAAPWLLMYDLFSHPSDVERSRADYQAMKDRYEVEKGQWDQQKNMILSQLQEHNWDNELDKPPLVFHDISLEVVLAYLLDDLNFDPTEKEDVCIYPVLDKHGARVILSKVEGDMWPLQVLTSLEIAFVLHEQGVGAQFLRMRRGSREVPIEFAWDTFGPELQRLRGLEGFVGGIQNLRVYRKEAQASSGPNSPILCSMQYLHRPMRAPA